MIRRRTLLASAATLAAPAIARAAPVKLSFYYPIAVGGPIPAIIDGYCKDFHAKTGIEVTPVYAGNYGETMVKAVTAIRGGSGPQLAVLLAAEMHSLQDQDILISLDDMGLDDAGKKWMSGFYPAFLANSRVDGKLWSVPFQRSTAVMYYNKDAFKDAGLDPEKFPTTWADLKTAALKLVKKDGSGKVTRWGVKMAADVGNAQWTFGAMANQAGQILMNEAGTETYFNKPGAIDAMAYWRSFGDAGSTPVGVSTWGQLTPDFLEGNTAIIQHTTGNLTNLKNSAKFPFGIVGLPGKAGPRTVVGGGNIYFFKSASPEEHKAALEFTKFLTEPDRAADWSIKTGYIAVRPDAYETKALKDYIAGFPAADVARGYLPVATGELSTFENQKVYSALTNNIQACLSRAKTPAQAMADTQAEAERILKPFRKG
jgi:sn-glycerol 3-phosphate transport system substrate-binding protein